MFNFPSYILYTYFTINHQLVQSEIVFGCVFIQISLCFVIIAKTGLKKPSLSIITR
jgi:hypothetical protein